MSTPGTSIWATWGRATPANERRYSNDHRASVFEKAEAIAGCMDEQGYSILWLAEHHFQHEGYECIPNVLMAAVHLAHLISQLRIGCGFNITPTWHLLRLAEDFATTRARSRRSALRCSTPRPTAISSKSRSRSS